MSDAPTTGAFAIVPTNDISAALPFWRQMGFAAHDAGGDGQYYILTGWECEIHLRRGDPPPWDVPANNPFGVFVRTPHVAEIARLMDDHVIRPGGCCATGSGGSTKSAWRGRTTFWCGPAGPPPW